jgi:hypothetical protein
MRRLLIIPILIVGLLSTMAAQCEDPGTGTAPAQIRIPVTLETRGTAKHQRIRWKIVGKGKPDQGWDSDFRFNGQHYKHTVKVAEGEHIEFHAINNDDDEGEPLTTHVKCIIIAFKRQVDSDAHPGNAVCAWTAEHA